jgi:hypothetical protein
MFYSYNKESLPDILAYHGYNNIFTEEQINYLSLASYNTFSGTARPLISIAEYIKNNLKTKDFDTLVKEGIDWYMSTRYVETIDQCSNREIEILSLLLTHNGVQQKHLLELYNNTYLPISSKTFGTMIELLQAKDLIILDVRGRGRGKGVRYSIFLSHIFEDADELKSIIATKLNERKYI